MGSIVGQWRGACNGGRSLSRLAAGIVGDDNTGNDNGMKPGLASAGPEPASLCLAPAGAAWHGGRTHPAQSSGEHTAGDEPADALAGEAA